MNPATHDSARGTGAIASARFRVDRELGRGGMGIVYAAEDLATGRRVALKTLHQTNPRNIYRIKREFRVLADLQHPNLVALDELHVEDGRWFFTMELIDGVPFSAWVVDPISSPTADPSPPTATATVTTTISLPPDTAEPVASLDAPRGEPHCFDADRLLAATRDLGEALRFLHAVGRVHCDVKPSNTLVGADGRLTLLDFGLTRAWEGEDPVDARTRPEGTVRYMAPEQAAVGTVAPAADMYAVGVMLFEAITGRPPFEGTPVQILADKRRRVPPRPSTLVAEVPAVLDDLCVRLLAIEPDDRPTAADLVHALDRAAGHVERGLDRALAVSSPERFVGRTRALAQLQETFEAATGPGGSARLTVVRGEPGVGKTALARHFTQARRDDGAIVLASRCHEQEALPLRAFDGAIDQLSALLLTVQESRLDACLPADTSAAVFLFPVLGRVPAIARRAGDIEVEIRPEELQRRAVHVVRALLEVFTERAPVALFVDDLQWVDDASLQFLALLASGARDLPLWVVATARPSITEADDPLTRLGTSSAWWAERTEVVELGGLEATEAEALLDATWAHAIEHQARRTLIEDSGGHPFLLRELARYLAEQPHDEPASGLPTLADALASRIRALPPVDQRVLEAVALVGIPLELQSLSAATDVGLVDCAYAVQRLKGQQFLRIAQRAERKLLEPYHDRVREVIEALLETEDPSRRARIHQALAVSLWTHAPQPLGAAVFAIAENFNRAPQAEGSDARRQRTAINLEAGQQALAAADYRTALGYLDRATNTLEPGAWDTDFALSFDLHIAQMQANYLGGDHARAIALFEPLARRARRPADIARVYEIKVNLDMNEFRDADALRTAREGLDRLGHPLPEAPGQLRVLWEFVRAKRAVGRVRLTDVPTLPPNEDELSNALMRLYLTASHAALREDQNTMAVIGARGIREGIRGPSSAGAVMMVNYGWLRLGIFGEYDQAADVRAAVLEIYERFQEDPHAFHSAVLLNTHGFIGPWHIPYADCVPGLQSCREKGLRFGDDILAYVGPLLEAVVHQEIGGSVHRFLETAELGWQLNTRRRVRNWAQACEVLVLNGRRLLEPDPHDATEALAPLRGLAEEDSVAGMTWHLTRCGLAYRCGDLDTMQESIAGSRRVQHQGMGMIVMQIISFYEGLHAHARLMGTATVGRSKRAFQRQLKRAIRNHGAWAARCEANFGHRLRMLQGLAAHASGDRTVAIDHLTAARDSASRVGCDDVVAMALHHRAHCQPNPQLAREDHLAAAQTAEARGDRLFGAHIRQVMTEA